MKKNIDEAGITRAIACLAVVMVHISAIPVATLQPNSIHMIFFSLLNRGLKFTTPTFIFLSGLTLFYSYKDRSFNYYSFLKKRLSTTIIPYLIWSFIYYRYFIYEGYYIFSWSFLFENLLLANMSYHLYFILTIIQFYLLFGIFLYVFKKFSPLAVLMVLCSISIFTLRYIHIPYGDRFFMRYVFFFGLGCYTAIYIDIIREKLLQYKLFFIAAYIGATSYYGYQFYQYYGLKKPVNVFLVELTWFGFAITAIFFYFLLSNYIVKSSNQWIYKGLKKITACSYYVYLSHPLVLFLSEKFLTNRGVISITGRFVLNVLIVYGGTLPLAILYSSMKDRLKEYNRRRRAKEVTLHSRV
ncbi:acyltransferase [Natronincola ferrireducens]|uniref:Surface polysaccharide O-acyltransferase, integral membrane enzyme n=1 Tax=Natronincola ferrireducens TaxID=393762 RepID=A0A1G9G6A9_9FIRM|nr:acyltransferase [Natronincola ferrireducens]SDK96189.1 Surface polysaccharide O-acyltransferase, integral membrane enzyme [Natronincola ferrireducens]